MIIFACDLQRKSKIPLYEQLYLYIKTEIIEGRLSLWNKTSF